MNFKKTASSLLLGVVLITSSISPAFADGAKVVTIGVNNTAEQRQKILNYFGVKEDEVILLEVNNKEEREYLEGIATEAQLGTKTYSCAYVEPTAPGSGINVKSANITWVTPQMIKSVLLTSGITDANVVIAAVIPVSGSGGITGIMKAFEDSTGEKLDEEKKELASEELIITGNLGDEIGSDKATGIINDVKLEVIKNGTSDTTQIAETINNVTNNYNITLTDKQTGQIIDLMAKISKQDYDYNAMKDTLNDVSDIVLENLKEAGEKVGNSGIFEAIGEFFSGIGEWISGLFTDNSKDLGILVETNDNILGDNAVITATDKDAENLISKENVEGFFQKVISWFKGLFSNESEDTNLNQEIDVETSEEPMEEPSIDEDINYTEDNTVENTDENIKNTDENIENTDESTNDSTLDIETSSEEHFDSEDIQEQ